MAGKCKEMSKIKQVLRLHKDGMSNRRIGRELGLYKDTVNKYVKLAKSDPLGIDKLLEMDDPVLEWHLTGGNPAYSDERFQRLQKRLPSIMEEMANKDKTHVTLYLLWQEYKQDDPNGYEYTQFCYHYNQYIGAQKPTFVLKSNWVGGNYIFVDFAGDTRSYIDKDTGEVVECQIFIATLPASDYGFIKAVHSQKIEDFISCLEDCFRYLGGAPKIIVTDNLKSAVKKADRYAPDINQTLEDFANHYNCVVIPTRSAAPTDKALVESQVRRSYQHIYAPLRNREFFSIQELNDALQEMMRQHNQRRMQRIPFTREERFISIDKPNLMPLNAEPFEIKYRKELKVQENSYIYLTEDAVYYSVPYKLIGQRVKVEYTRTHIAMYFGGERVSYHMRSTLNKYVYKEEHLPSYYKDYVNLSPQKYISRAKALSEQLGEVISRMFASNTSAPPETFYKSCDGLIHLQKVTKTELFEKACSIAIEFNSCKYTFIKNLIASKCSGYKRNDEEDDNILFPPDNHENIRGPQYYETH